MARGSLNPANYLIDAEAGFEIWQGGQGLATNSFSFNGHRRDRHGRRRHHPALDAVERGR